MHNVAYKLYVPFYIKKKGKIIYSKEIKKIQKFQRIMQWQW